MTICEPCPRCGSRDTELLSTTNEPRYYCPTCDLRFADGANEGGVIVAKQQFAEIGKWRCCGGAVRVALASGGHLPHCASNSGTMNAAKKSRVP